MKVKDIIKIACDYIGCDDIVSKLELSEPNLSENQQKTVNNLVKCLNLVQNEIATEFIPLSTIEEVKAQDFKVLYSSFSKKPIAIVDARDKFYRRVRFRAFADYLMIYAASAKVKYYYQPAEITSCEQDLTEALVPMRTYAYGVVREYYLQQSLSDEADIFEVRFKDSIEVFSRKKNQICMPRRRWL